MRLALAAPPGRPPDMVRELDPLQLSVDLECLAAVWLLTLVVLGGLMGGHIQLWRSPRLQALDVRLLLYFASLASIGLAKAATGWSFLPVRALLDGYAIYLAFYALPVLLLGGDARLEHAASEHRAARTLKCTLLGLLVVRVVVASAVLASGWIGWVNDSVSWAYAIDAGFSLLHAAAAAWLFSLKLGEDTDAGAETARIRRAVPLFVAGMSITGTVQDLLVFPLSNIGLQLSGVLSVYELLAVVLLTAPDLDAGNDRLLAVLPDKVSSFGGKLQFVAAAWDVFAVPFDKQAFFQVRSAVHGLERGLPVSSPPSINVAAPYAASSENSDGESIYSPRVG